MANKPLQSIKFPGLPDTYIVPQIDDTLTQPGRPADAKVAGDKVTQLSNAVYTKIWTCPRREWYFEYRINPANPTSLQANTHCMVSRPILAKSAMAIKLINSAYTASVFKYSTEALSSYVSQQSIVDTYICEIGYYYMVALRKEDGMVEGSETFIQFLVDDEQAKYIDVEYGAVDTFDGSIIGITQVKKSNEEGVSFGLNQISLTSPFGYRISTSSKNVWTHNSYKFDSDVLIKNYGTVTINVIDVINNSIIGTVDASNRVLRIPANTEFIWVRTAYESSYENVLRIVFFEKTTNIVLPTESTQIVNFDLTRKSIRAYTTGLTFSSELDSASLQDCDQYDKYLALYTSGDHTFYIRDLDTNTMVNKTALTAEQAGHGNTICFTDQFYDETDPVPLLLCADMTSPTIHVIRFDSEFVASEVNQITVTCEGEASSGFAYDRWSHTLYAIRWDMPSTSKTGILISQLSANFDFATDTSYAFENAFYIKLGDAIQQGICAYSGYLFIVMNSASYNDAYVYVIDISKGIICDKITCLAPYFNSYEMEGIWFDPNITPDTVTQKFYIMRYDGRIGVIEQLN